MTATPETTTSDVQPTARTCLVAMMDGVGHAYALTRQGRTEEATEHVDALERLIGDYRKAVSVATPDTMAAWLYRRFSKSAVTWDALDQDEQAYWQHEANAVQRAVARGGFKEVE